MEKLFVFQPGPDEFWSKPARDKRMARLGRAKQHANEAMTILNL